MLLELTGRGGQKIWIAPQHVITVCENNDAQGRCLHIQMTTGLVYVVNAALQDVLDRLAPFNRP